MLWSRVPHTAYCCSRCLRLLWSKPVVAEDPGDVRVESEGSRTEVKRGIGLTPGDNTGLRFNMTPGIGLHVGEYSTGGLAREEVAVRLRTLETLVDELEARLAGAENPY